MAFLTYRQPGVYTRYIDDPTLVRAFGLFRIPAIIGPGKDTLQIQNQILNRGYSRSVSLASEAAAGTNEIELATEEHDLISGDIIEITNYQTNDQETAIVVFVQGATIVVDTDPLTADGQMLQYTYPAEYSRIKEISMKDKVIPASDGIVPANISGLDDEGNPTTDIVTADCIDAVGFAPFINNYRPNVDYDANLIRDDVGNWYLKWLKAAYVVNENLARNGRTNDINSGTAYEFYVGHRGLSNADGEHVPDTLGEGGADHYQDIIDAIEIKKYVNGQYVTATYIDAMSVEREYTITFVDPVNGKITLNATPSAAEMQDGLFVTYYYSNRKPEIGDDYYISFQVMKSDAFYLPAIYTDSSQIVFDFGRPDLNNPISLAAFLCLGAGADRVNLVQTKKSAVDPDTGERSSSVMDYRIAFALLEAEEISIMVPLSTDETVQSYAFSHCVKLSSMLHRRERFAIFTVDDSGFSRKQDEISFYKDIANGYERTGSGERVILLAPPKVWLPQTDEQGVTTHERVSSYYAAASIMGGLIARDPAEPLTRKQVSGFSGLAGTWKYTEADKDYMAGNGVTILDEFGNVILVRHGMTTDTTSPNKSEVSVVQIKDFVAKSLRAGLENAYVGRKIVPSTIIAVGASTDAILGRLKVNQIIFDYAGVDVKEDPYDPTQLNVAFQMKPIYPLNYIMISITLNARLGS